MRDDIVAYNRDDCVSTVLLHAWLLERAKEAEVKPGGARAGPAEETDDERERRKEREVKETTSLELQARIVCNVAETDPEWPALRLTADLVDFHRREDKPEWWAFFDRQEAETEALIVLCPRETPSDLVRVFRLHFPGWE